jgi:hypothetical protein
VVSVLGGGNDPEKAVQPQMNAKRQRAFAAGLDLSQRFPAVPVAFLGYP